ncbi:MAG: 3-alpha-hydroxysteroid dehydrogenase [Acidimicrobiales bacterium]|nr:3-alpha-hydroxysteroid dehydrogenase [Acidimicrobiales bacterium]
MEDALQYEGKRVLVTGCASGMGAAAAQILVDLGAEVIGLDVKPTEVPVKVFHAVDLRDKASIDAVAGAIDGPVHAVFSVAGLPGPPFPDIDTVLVNFVGARHLIETLVPKMAPGGAVVCVASNAGLGWQQDLESLMPLVTTDGFDTAKAWCEANPAAIDQGYAPSKKLVNAWVAWRGTSLMKQGIRLNTINPGPTETAMMPAFENQHGKDLIDAFIGPSGRRSTADEQAWPMVFLNSPRSSYIAAEALHVDGGFLGAMVTGQLEVNLPE